MIPNRLPRPAQVAEYLTARHWRSEWPFGADGAMFVFQGFFDDGEPITVFVPGSSDVIHYPLRVSDVVDTLAWVERRSKDAVWADLGASGAGAGSTPTAATSPAASAPPPGDPITS